MIRSQDKGKQWESDSEHQNVSKSLFVTNEMATLSDSSLNRKERLNDILECLIPLLFIVNPSKDAQDDVSPDRVNLGVDVVCPLINFSLLKGTVAKHMALTAETEEILADSCSLTNELAVFSLKEWVTPVGLFLLHLFVFLQLFLSDDDSLYLNSGEFSAHLSDIEEEVLIRPSVKF